MKLGFTFTLLLLFFMLSSCQKERLMDNNDKMVDLNENNNGNHDLTNNQGVGVSCEGEI